MFEKKSSKSMTFVDALLGDTDWCPLSLKPSRPQVSSENLTEKAVVLESFTRFAEEQLSESDNKTLSFPGGEIALKPKESEAEFQSSFLSFKDWSLSHQEKVGERIWQTVNRNKTNLKVLFVAESYRPEEVLDMAEKPANDEFLLCFEPQVATLFQKMVQAMKLEPSEFALSCIESKSGTRAKEELLDEVFWLKPQFVIPLGAQASQMFIGQRERLASAHGKYFPLSAITSFTSHIVPLFHPSVIATNLNMKKSTWTDMQKIMQSLGKA